MIILIEQLQQAIDRLPDPDKYQYNEYATIILDPAEIRPYRGNIPETGHGKDLLFKKVWTDRGKYEWTIDI
ncbi:MAG: hypothetical protein JZU49_00115 [Sulfuricurvum sp.]|nr:hypothetical protein [Sulfuricurvum sp.]